VLSKQELSLAPCLPVWKWGTGAGQGSGEGWGVPTEQALHSTAQHSTVS